ncbi:hypothetical protein ACLB2K_046985 [Fragaria x ananassa]
MAAGPQLPPAPRYYEFRLSDPEVSPYGRERNELYFYFSRSRLKGSPWTPIGESKKDIKSGTGEIVGSKKTYSYKNSGANKWRIDLFLMADGNCDKSAVRFYENTLGKKYKPQHVAQPNPQPARLGRLSRVHASSSCSSAQPSNNLAAACQLQPFGVDHQDLDAAGYSGPLDYGEIGGILASPDINGNRLEDAMHQGFGQP